MFISYSREQRAYVRRLADHLREAAGVEAWFDYEIFTGERWDKVVRTKIDECAALILVMTPDAEDSHWVAEEVERARSRGKELLPLLLEGSPIFGFSTVQYEDVRGGGMPGDRFLRHLDEAIGGRRPPVAPQRSRGQLPRRRIEARQRRVSKPRAQRSAPPSPRNRRLDARFLALGLTAAATGLAALLVSPLSNALWPLVITSDSSGQQTSAGSSTITTSSTTSSSTAASTTSVAPGRNVRLSCYNNSTIVGLLARACDDAKSFGWTIADRGKYSEGVIPTTTVYYRSDPEEEAAARELAALLRMRVEPRFDGITGQPPGLIMIVTNDYQGPSRNG
ncbi:toll/interleukin-1 receptor domain-containing protein [Lentzea rhizosphaerae]|uniref:Toll/interleukin-1 receptor domain-containing protein n=1 Tax=Lentzea rhizosphaerae TaxID=2041025 RepID=A0ABV8BZL5_9PSEU